jgi:hypothetical protein
MGVRKCLFIYVPLTRSVRPAVFPLLTNCINSLHLSALNLLRVIDGTPASYNLSTMIQSQRFNDSIN